MIYLFTDFGRAGPYIGQMEAAIYKINPRVRVVDLMADAPRFNPAAAGHLLAAVSLSAQEGDIFVAVVDPGVGSELRRPVVVEADGRLYVGPDNGLFDVVVARAAKASKRLIQWLPESLSSSFHGRDLFAPVAAALSAGIELGDCEGRRWLGEVRELDVGDASCSVGSDQVVYIDGFGNCMTGLVESDVGLSDCLVVGDIGLYYAQVFAEVPPGEPFWYVNSIGLVEVAVNQGSARELLHVAVGERVAIRR